MKSHLLLPVLSTACFTLAVPLPSRAEESLFDKKEAHTVSPALQKIFGPKSAGLRYDARMIRAAEIAQRRAEPRKTWYCWRYVKNALIEAGVVSSRPNSAWAKQAGEELCRRYGFVRIPNVKNPTDAPVGAVLVYGGEDAGHVEIRTESGFVSDFTSRTPYPRPFLGAFVKPS